MQNQMKASEDTIIDCDVTRTRLLRVLYRSNAMNVTVTNGATNEKSQTAFNAYVPSLPISHFGQIDTYMISNEGRDKDIMMSVTDRFATNIQSNVWSLFTLRIVQQTIKFNMGEKRKVMASKEDTVTLQAKGNTQGAGVDEFVKFMLQCRYHFNM